MRRIHGLCLIKDEADIIEQAIRAAVAWCDAIYVYDNGSTDGTWEKIHALAKVYPQVIPFCQNDAPFSDGLRSVLFNAFRNKATADDWWCRLDADEFYVENPRVFLSKVCPPYDVVWTASLSYYFTTVDADRYRADPSQFAGDVPIEQKCQHYLAHWSEVRFCRNVPSMQWPDGGTQGWPIGINTMYRHYPGRIIVKHFPYRSPKQIEARIQSRMGAICNGQFRHEAMKDWSAMIDPVVIERERWKNLAYVQPDDVLETTWESRVVRADRLYVDHHDGRFTINEHLMPTIPGTPVSVELRRLRDTRLLNNRLTQPFRRLTRQLLQRLGWMAVMGPS
jgi:glycosyltransferase involved in cell wall biosynthesis